MALGRKTGGRQKGTLNKATVAQAANIAASGQTPLGYMIDLMRDTAAPPEMRLDAAKAAAPYVHPKLASVQVTGKDGEDLVPRETDPGRVSLALLAILRAAAAEPHGAEQGEEDDTGPE